jgi:hypothetical protein
VEQSLVRGDVAGRDYEMTRGELVEWLVKNVKEYRNSGVLKSVRRNNHMNDYKGENVSQETLDAVLVDFVNFLGMQQGIDLAMYTSDLKPKDS